MMTAAVDFDAERVRLILRDLERTIGGTPYRPSLRLERGPEALAGVVIRGVATRMGMVRLGLRIARQAIEAESITLIEANQVDVEGRDLSVIEIDLVEAPFLKPEPRESGGAPAILVPIGCYLMALATITTFLVGAVTIVWFLWQIGGSLFGG